MVASGVSVVGVVGSCLATSVPKHALLCPVCLGPCVAVVSGVSGRCWLCGPCSSSVRCQWSLLAVWPLQQWCQLSVVGAGGVAPAAIVSVGVGLSAIDCQLMVHAWEGLVPGRLVNGNQL